MTSPDEAPETDVRPAWVRDLEAKHGLPLEEIPGTIYTLCYDPPFLVRSVSTDYSGPDPASDSYGYLAARPISHYVGWTQQADPKKRIRKHHPAKTPVTVSIVGPGTMLDEHALKRTGTCPTCGQPFAASLTLWVGQV